MAKKRKHTLDETELLKLARIAVPGLETLQERKRDSLDFHETSVVNLEKALRAAYELGRSQKGGE